MVRRVLRCRVSSRPTSRARFSRPADVPVSSPASMPTSSPRAADARAAASWARGRRIIWFTWTSRSGRPGVGECVRRAAPDCGVLFEARPIRASPHADRSRRARGAGHGRQPGRRLLAVDALRDGARLLRHEHDARGIAGRVHPECRMVSRSRRLQSAASRSGKLMDAVIVRGGLIELLRVGTGAIRDVIKTRNGRHATSSITEQLLSSFARPAA